jgi:hypothetical protein
MFIVKAEMKKKNILNRSFFELTGCIHTHSEHSFDSSKPVRKIIQHAKKQELDYITINDHLNLDAKKEESVLSEKDLFVIVCMEVNDKQNNNHYLVFNSDEILRGKDAKEYVTYYAQSNAVCFAAHPIEKRVSSKFRTYIWTDLTNDGFDGLEIWNYLSEWIGKMNPKLNGLFLVLFPSLFIRKPYRQILEWWDKMNREGKRKAGIGSIDAHSEKMEKFGFRFTFLTHRQLFKTIRTNVLLEENEPITQQAILTAIKNGNSYIVNYKAGNPYDFYAGISDAEGNSAIFGEDIKFVKGLKYYFKLPVIAKVTLFRDGKKISSQRDEKGFFEIKQKGNYRLEITRWGYGWIYSNNIYVT